MTQRLPKMSLLTARKCCITCTRRYLTTL